MTIWTYRDALEELWRRSSYERGLITNPFGAPEKAALGLRRTRALLAALGDPQLAAPLVHVAGSKGKGSTCAFIASAAQAAGLRAGFYSSPHLHRFPERIAIDGAPVSDEEFAAVAQLVAAAAAQVENAEPDLGTISTFEMITAMAFLAFARAQCDLAVIEVGLGGLYDSTNVIDPLVSVITRIDYEHTAVLGDSLTEIAQQKAGIMRAGVPCVVSPQEPEAAQAIAQVAAATGTPLVLGGRDWTWQGDWRAFSASGPWGDWGNLAVGIAGPHQVENACTALAALHELSSRGVHISEDAIRLGLKTARWPGRFEQVETPGRHYVLDGAHTPAAARALAETWRDTFGEQQATAIIGMGSDKDVPAFLTALSPILRCVIATRATSPRAAEPAAIVAAASGAGLPASEAPGVEAALLQLAGEDSLVLATGSLFVAGEVREALGLAEPDREWAAINAAHLAAPTGQKTG
ncbi:MAG: folylpolyglutamate synthase/dihydrofolate synthase family protein [Thermomicrobiales bacterium]